MKVVFLISALFVFTAGHSQATYDRTKAKKFEQLLKQNKQQAARDSAAKADTVEYITVKDIDRAVQGLKAQVSALQYDEQLKASIEYLRSAIKEAARIRRNKKP